MVKNELNHTRNEQNDVPKFLIFSGIISAINKNGNVIMAQEAIKIVNETLTIGIYHHWVQSKVVTLLQKVMINPMLSIIVVIFIQIVEFTIFFIQ